MIGYQLPLICKSQCGSKKLENKSPWWRKIQFVKIRYASKVYHRWWPAHKYCRIWAIPCNRQMLAHHLWIYESDRKGPFLLLCATVNGKPKLEFLWILFTERCELISKVKELGSPTLESRNHLNIMSSSVRLAYNNHIIVGSMEVELIYKLILRC